MSRSLFLSILEDVVRDRVSPFLDLLSLVRLDSALLVKEHRPNVLRNFLRNATLTDEVCYNFAQTEWLIMRGVHVTILRFPPDAVPSDVVFATSILSEALFVDMDNCTNFTNESVQYLLRHCESKSLRGLGCEGCEWLSDETLKVLADHHGHSLNQFFLSECSSVTDAGAAYVLSHSPGICDVQWEGCEQVGVLAMAALVNHSVETFFAVNCPAIPEGCIIAFLERNSDFLRSVALGQNQHLGDATLLTLARHCPSLETLNINECEGFGNFGLCAVVQSCQKLTELSMDDVNISTVVLECMCTHLSPVLTSLCMAGCAEFGPEHLPAIVQRTPMLREIALGRSAGLNDHALKGIGAHCSNLVSVTIQECDEITFPGIKALTKNNPNLMELNFSMCPNVCDRSLTAIAKFCPVLRQLNVAGNPTITDQGTSAIAKYSAKLESINLGYTYITEKGLVRVMKACRALHTVEFHGRVRVEGLSEVLMNYAARRKITLVTEDEFSDSEGSEDSDSNEDDDADSNMDDDD